MNQTINISLPKQLKIEADSLIKAGIYASFSDLARTAIRKVVSVSKYDLLAEEVEKDYGEGKAIVLKNKQDIDKYFDSI
jgi:Arc/MetJ-type ribon-helix-helix transcriptional regulator